MMCPTVNSDCINGKLEPGLWSMQGQENRYMQGNGREGGQKKKFKISSKGRSTKNSILSVGMFM